MELGQGGITTLTFVPEYDGNSSLPDDERLSVQIIPFRAADQMASMNQTTERLQQWRDDELKDWLDSPEFGAQIRRFSIEVLLTMRLFVEHVTKPRNFYNNGVPIEDPVELFLRLPFPINSQREVMAWGIIQSLVDADTGERLVEVQQAAKDMIEANADSGITQEIVAAIRKTQGLSGDALKNLVSVFDGSSSETTSPEGSLYAHVLTETSPTAASTPEEATAPSASETQESKNGSGQDAPPNP